MNAAFALIEKGHKQSDLANTTGAAYLYFSAASSLAAEVATEGADPKFKSLLNDNVSEYLNKACGLIKDQEDDILHVLHGLEFVVKRSYGDESITGNKSSDDEKNMLKQGLEASQRMFASSDDVKDIYDIYSDDAKLPAATGAPATAQPSSNSSYDDLSARLSKLTQSKEEDKKDDIAARLNALKGLPDAPPSETDVLKRMQDLGCDTSGLHNKASSNNHDLDDVSNIINAVQDEIRLDDNTKTLNNVPVPKDDTTEFLLSMVGEGGAGGAGGIAGDEVNDEPINDDILAGSTFSDIMSSLQNSNLISSEVDANGNPGVVASGLPLSYEDKVNMKVGQLQQTVFGMMTKEAEEGGSSPGVDVDAVLAKVKAARKDLDEIEKIVKGGGVVKC